MPIELTNIGRTYHLEGGKSDLQLTIVAGKQKDKEVCYALFTDRVRYPL